jgi:ABC-type methionine transport system ATPase subunit
MSRLNIHAEEYIPVTYSINNFSEVEEIIADMFHYVINKTKNHRSIYKRRIIRTLYRQFNEEMNNIKREIEEYYNIEKNNYFASYKKKSIIEKQIEEFEKKIKILNSDINKIVNMSSYRFDMLILKTDNPTVHSVVENLFK